MTVCRGGYARIAALIALGLLATPLPAQNATVPDVPPPPSSNGVVGPRELQNFSLPGAVVRPAEPAASVPARPQPTPAPTATRPTQDSTVTQTRSAPIAPVAPRRRETVATPAPRPSDAAVAPPPEAIASAPSVVTDASPALTFAPRPSQGRPLWPWFLAVLAAAGAAALIYFKRQQGEAQVAHAGGGPEAIPAPARLPAARPVPQPLPRSVETPPPALAPRIPPSPPPIPGGIVATALKPELELIFTPLSVAVDDAGTAMVVFDLVVHNHGSAPARDVLVEAGMFNAGPQQDVMIGDFFANPRAEGDRIPMIAPMGKVGVRSRVSIPADRIGAIEMAGRKLLVPLVAFNTLFRWSGGETQRSASFLVGRGNNDELKLAPFALDRGTRAWGDVAARSHSMGLAS